MTKFRYELGQFLKKYKDRLHDLEMREAFELGAVENHLTELDSDLDKTPEELKLERVINQFMNSNMYFIPSDKCMICESPIGYRILEINKIYFDHRCSCMINICSPLIRAPTEELLKVDLIKKAMARLGKLR